MSPETEGTLVHYLVRNGEAEQVVCLRPRETGRKEGRPPLQAHRHSDNYYLLEVDLQTGRHHQIRCQLAKMGCPIKGDLKYGFPRSNPDGSICLHARRVSFVHPVSKMPIDLEAPLPDGNLWNCFRTL